MGKIFDRFKYWLKSRHWKEAKPDAVNTVKVALICALDGKITGDEFKLIIAEALKAGKTAGLWEWD